MALKLTTCAYTLPSATCLAISAERHGDMRRPSNLNLKTGAKGHANCSLTERALNLPP
jgi:hypothetical protein